jgi:hypothetical protein
MKRYTREQLIFFLKRLATELKRTPTIKDLKGRKMPSSTTYLKRFGTWNNVLRVAELKINVKMKYTPQELLENLKILAKELGRTPTSADLAKKDWIASSSTYRKYFGSIQKALAAAGIRKQSTIKLSKYGKKTT